MNIDMRTIEDAAEQIGDILKAYRLEIDKAFLKAEDSLTISLGLTFKEVYGKMEITTPIKFVTDQVKDSFKRSFDRQQETLFPPKVKLEIAKPINLGWFSMPDCRVN